MTADTFLAAVARRLKQRDALWLASAALAVVALGLMLAAWVYGRPGRSGVAVTVATAITTVAL